VAKGSFCIAVGDDTLLLKAIHGIDHFQQTTDEPVSIYAIVTNLYYGD
jgi:hypothetical protein